MQRKGPLLRPFLFSCHRQLATPRSRSIASEAAPSLDGCGERKGTVRPGINTETHADEIAQLLGTGGREKTCPKLPAIVASSQA
ncbi:MAG: hypothetical protein GEU91_24640 [Rhizobiales bacterium]|nr:hypothetical protein [Hyphomicrobiales bacterium]